MMKIYKNKLMSAAISATVAGGALFLPGVSHAELETTLHMHTMNLFRGQTESEFAPAFHGEIEYGTKMGLYAGTEIVNSAEGGGLEWDLMYGYEREMGDFSFNLGMVHYMYPLATEHENNDPYADEKRTSLSDSMETEFKIGFGFQEYSLTYYTNTDSDVDATYISLDYQGKKFGVHYGITDSSEDDPNDSSMKIETNYSDLALSYGLTEEVTLTVSIAMGDAVGDELEDVDGDPLVMLSYQIPLGGKHGD